MPVIRGIKRAPAVLALVAAVGADLRARPRVGEGSALPREAKGLPYQDIPGFCKSAPTEEIAAHGYVLTPGRDVGAEAIEEDDEPFEEKRRSRAASAEPRL
jgi:type I restriction enzyme M protein